MRSWLFYGLEQSLFSSLNKFRSKTIFLAFPAKVIAKRVGYAAFAGRYLFALPERREGEANL